MNLFRPLLLLAVFGVACAQGAAIPEPETLFYGAVINRIDSHAELLTSGQLAWTIRDGNGGATTLKAELEVLPGNLSYRLKVPHQALSNGLTVTGALPLGAAPATYQHLGISLDGKPARIVAPGSVSFTAEQLQRAATHRLDVEISQPFTDSDGDGMPDWWEDQYGLDKFRNDAGADLDKDGQSNLAEYRAGTNPASHANHPDLLTRELFAFADGANALAIKTADADTPPSQLVYTLVQAPSGGLALRNTQAGPDAPLRAGSIFTQADLNAGRVVFAHEKDGALDPLRLALRISDGTATVTGDVTLRFYRPALSGSPESLAALAEAGAEIPGVPAAEQGRARIYLLARAHGVIAWDWTHAGASADAAVSEGPEPAFNAAGSTGRRVRFAILGGSGSDTLTGASGDDVLVSDRGDDKLTGGRGADRFVLGGADGGKVTVTDFQPAEGDILDLGAALSGASKDLRDYVQLNGSTLALDADGTGAIYKDLQVSLPGLDTGANDLFTLFHSGRLAAAGKTLPSAVSIVATQPEASENGPAAATLTVTRIGPIDTALSVGIAVGGSATNGQDYEAIPDKAVIAAGQRSAQILVRPFADAVSEPAEIVQVTLQPGTGYALVGLATAQAAIADLLPEFSIEAIEPNAIVEGAQPATFLITRTGLVDRSVLARLQIGGNATPGDDYTRLPAFVNFAANQTTALLSVTPSATAKLEHGAESVVMTLVSNAAYRVSANDRALVTISRASSSAAAWRAQNFEVIQAIGKSAGLSEFLAEDPGGLRIPNLLRYAFALDAHAPGAAAGAANMPQSKLVDGHLAIEFARTPAASDLRFIVEITEDMRVWRSGAGHVEEITARHPPGDGRRVLWRAVKSAAQAPMQSMRVRVEMVP